MDVLIRKIIVKSVQVIAKKMGFNEAIMNVLVARGMKGKMTTAFVELMDKYPDAYAKVKP